MKNDLRGDILTNVVNSDQNVKEAMIFIDADAVYKAGLCTVFLNYLKKLQEKNTLKFYKFPNKNFGKQLCDDNSFCLWLSKQLGIDKPYRLQRRIQFWKEKDFLETRGANSLSLEVKQKGYDEWKKNSILSVDKRNARDKVSISKLEFIRNYKGLINQQPEVEEIKNKRALVRIMLLNVVSLHALFVTYNKN